MTNFKHYLQTCTALRSLQQCENNSALRESLLSGNILSLDTFFYLLHCSQREEDGTLREWTARSLLLSAEEATVWKHDYESSLRRTKRWSMQLKAPIEARIAPITLEEVLSDEEMIERLSERIEHITPYSVTECEEAREGDEIVWFIDGLETYHLIRQGDEILYPACKEGERLPIEFSIHHYGIIQNTQGKYGIIDFKGRRVHVECMYERIIWEHPLVQCALMIPDSRESLIDIPAVLIDLNSLNVISTTALFDTLDYKNRFIDQSEEGRFHLCRFDPQNNQIIPLSRWYGEIMCDGHEGMRAVRDAQSGLYGYVDDAGGEVIACRFADWSFFNYGHAILEEDGKAFVIDKTGEIVIPAVYDEIILNKTGSFIVRDGTKWGVFHDGELIIPTRYDEILGEESRFFYVREDNRWAVFDGGSVIVDFDTYGDDPYSDLLRKLYGYYESFHDKRFSMSLREYLALFPPLHSQKDFMFARIWGARVQVRACEIIERYQEVLSDPTQGTIGWYYPVSGDIFDFEVELPVVFEKIDGGSVSLGINYEDLELIDHTRETG
ncbi:MAG: WG repeat-containing protein [Sulfuricurvum sp.]|nr:WG repeat-containing protein [Sulfuricurvum sp.]